MCLRDAGGGRRAVLFAGGLCEHFPAIVDTFVARRWTSVCSSLCLRSQRSTRFRGHRKSVHARVSFLAVTPDMAARRQWAQLSGTAFGM